MANDKSTPIKPMPFPGESPTVALAMAAGQKYGLHEEPEKPAKASPKRKASAKKKAAKASPKRKPAAKKKAAKPARKPKAAKPGRVKKAR
jgi:hypothetical protein